MLPYFAILFGASEGCQTILVIKRESFIETNLQYIMQQAIPKLLPIYEHKAIFWKGILLFCLPSQNATIYQTGHGKWRTQEGNLYDFHWVIHVLPVDVTELFLNSNCRCILEDCSLHIRMETQNTHKEFTKNLKKWAGMQNGHQQHPMNETPPI